MKLLGLLLALVFVALVFPAFANETLYFRDDLAANVSVPGSTATTIITRSITMPTSIGPWRIRAHYGIIAGGDAISNTAWEFWVDDQQSSNNLFADRGAFFPTGCSCAFAGSGISRNTYAAGTTVTFLLRVRIIGGANTVFTGYGSGVVAKTHLELVVEPD